MASYIGVIQQNTYLFNMTVLENLRIGRADATEEEVWDVLEQVGLRAMVERLPQGLSTMVDEAGCASRAASATASRSRACCCRTCPWSFSTSPPWGSTPSPSGRCSTRCCARSTARR